VAEFSHEFAAAWAAMTTRFLKVECWQEYREIEAAPSQEAYRRGDIALAQELLRAEAEADRPLYADISRSGIEFARIRLVKPPLTPYLRYEMMAYRIRAAMGETIEVVELPATAALPSADYFDFLVFDAAVALVHDYGTGSTGHQSGGWLVRDRRAVASLADKALRLRAGARPLGESLGREGQDRR
jgi:hypothetical protein